MCGIAGVVTLDRPLADRSAVARLLSDALAHRGPDGEGVWPPEARPDPGGAGDVLLVHRRLAIIDPGPDGAQPMATPDGRHHLVFNGEVYNYRELRRDLEARGERFSTESDTEVLLRLLVRDGAAALARVRGMFALACWDDADRSLLLARDRFGIKPLYVASSASLGRGLAFASELAALRAARIVDGGPSPAGVLGFLSWGSVIPPLTWRRGVDMIAPGTWRRWRNGAIERGMFADARDAYRSASGASSGGSERDYRAAVGEAVRDSVRAHLVADVPVGVFLSGGLDSGAIVSAATSAGATNLQTFTVGFDDASSESDAARLVAAHFGTRHHDLRVDASHVAADLPRILAHLDQPSIDGVNSYYVSQAVAATGIKAVLSGTGGDEMFGGYPSFTRIPRALSARRGCGPFWPLVAPIAGAFMPSRLQTQWRHFAAADESLVEAYRVQRGFLLPEDLDALAGPALRDAGVWRDAHGELDAAEHALLDPSGPGGAETPWASVARLESRLYLASQLLRDVDVMAMAHGLEVRVPFVDHELLRVVWPELGRRPGLFRHKRLLHETLERPLPGAIVGRPKHGFTLPFSRWIGGELAPVVRDGLARLADAHWVTPDAPARVWNAWTSGRVHWTRPWGLAILGRFLASAQVA